MNLCPACGFTKDGQLHLDYCRESPLRQALEQRARPQTFDSSGSIRNGIVTIHPCPCECNAGGFCGGCGHAGCGGRSTPRRDHLRP